VTQQNEHDAVIASGLSPNDRVVTTGFANLSDGSKVIIGRDEQTPSADLAPRKRTRAPDGQKKDGQAKDGQKDGQKDVQGKDGRAKRSSSEGDQKGQTGPAAGPGAQQSGPGAKQP
jgi:multidrug efflux system membrane fusion protein